MEVDIGDTQQAQVLTALAPQQDQPVLQEVSPTIKQAKLPDWGGTSREQRQRWRKHTQVLIKGKGQWLT
jgi:hypothetical protein